MRKHTWLLVAALLALVVAPTQASSPRWREVSRTKIPLTYWQGMTHDEVGARYFSGPHVGLWKTDAELNEIGRNPDIIPPQVHAEESYNHIGDISYYGGKVYLPLECYYFQAGNTCKTAAIGVADAQTLEWEYYVRLNADPNMEKAMWNEISPDGQLLWTSNQDPDGKPDLVAYRVSHIVPANAAPEGGGIRPVRVLEDAVPPSGITGATFIGDRLFLAGGGPEQIWSVDLADGSRRLELEIDFVGEAEGLDDDFELSTQADSLPGELHWQVMPYNEEGIPTNGLDGVIYNFQPRPNPPPPRSKNEPCKPHPHGKHRKHCH
jgi:hypothetical protein